MSTKFVGYTGRLLGLDKVEVVDTSIKKPVVSEVDNYCWRCKSYHPKDQACLMPR